MATTYSSSRASVGQSAKSRTGIVCDVCTFSVPSVGFALNDIMQLFKIPAMARVVDFSIDMPPLDSNAAAAVVIGVGDANAGGTGVGPTGYISGNTQAKLTNTGTLICYPATSGLTGVSGQQLGALAKLYQSDDVLSFKITTAPATPTTAGTGKAVVWYEMDSGLQGTL